MVVLVIGSMTQDSLDELEVYDPDVSLSVSSDEQHQEIDALRSRITAENLELDAERVYDQLSDEELSDARYTARRACLAKGDFSKYMSFLVSEILGAYNSGHQYGR